MCIKKNIYIYTIGEISFIDKIQYFSVQLYSSGICVYICKYKNKYKYIPSAIFNLLIYVQQQF